MNKYFLVPVAACVATVSLAPVAIHAQTWTQQFDAKQDVKLDYTFTVTFNDVPKAELIKEIVAVQGDKTFKTNVEYVAGAKYVRVTVDSLQYNSSYELQVHLQNGLKYKMDFTTTVDPAAGTEPGTNPGTTDPETNPGTDPEEPLPTSTVKADLQLALQHYVDATSFFSLEYSGLYENAFQLITEYEDAVNLGNNVATLEQNLADMLININDATTRVKGLHEKLQQATKIVEQGPFQQADMQSLLDEFIWQVEAASTGWITPLHISTDEAEALVKSLEQMAKTDPEAAQRLIDKLHEELETYVEATDYLYLDNTLIYKNAEQAIALYEQALFDNANIQEAEQAMHASITTVQQATAKFQQLHTKLTEAAAIVEKGPYQLDELQVAFDDFLWQLDFDIIEWSTADHVSLTSVNEMIKTLNTLATTNPYIEQLTTLSTEIDALLKAYSTSNVFQYQIMLEHYFKTGQELTKQAKALHTSLDEEAITDAIYNMEEFIDASSDYFATVETIKELHVAATEAQKSLNIWKQLFPILSTDVNTIQTTIDKMRTDFTTLPYTELEGQVTEYDEALSTYIYDLESYIEELLAPEVTKYEGYYYTFLETKTEVWLESARFLAFAAALDEMRSSEFSDATATVAHFKKLQTTYKAL